MRITEILLESKNALAQWRNEEPREYERRIKQLYKNKLNPDPDWWPDTTKEIRK